MAKAKTAEVVAEDAAVSIAPPAPRKKRGKPVAIEVHEVKTVWSEEKVIGEKPKAPPKRREPEYEPEEDASDEDEDDNLPEEVADFLRNQGESSSDVLMEVRFIRDGNGRVRPNEGIYCGTFNFNPDTYLEDLALMELAPPNKPARFVLRLKQDGRYITGGTINAEVLGASIEKKLAAGTITATPAASATVTQPPVQQYAPPPAVDLDAEFEKRMAWVERFEKLARRNDHSAPQSAAPAELSEEAILLKAAMASPDAKEKIANGIGKLVFGGASESDDSKEPYWFGPAFSLVSNILQGITPGLNALLQVTAQAKQVEIQRIQQPAPVASESVAAIPPPMPEAALVEPLPIQAQQEVPPEDELFARILAACAQKPLLKPDVAAQNLLEYTDQFTLESGFNKFRMGYDKFLTNDVKDIIQFAAMVNPIAARMASEPDTEGWLTALQGELRKELNGDEQDNEPS